jgi:DNA topoisomerase IA
LLKLAPKKILDVRSQKTRKTMSSEVTHLQIAEKLYQQGFLSYPRTETDKFDPQFNFMSLIEKQMADPAWGGFAREYVYCPFYRVFDRSMPRSACIKAHFSGRETEGTTTMRILPSTPLRMLGI